MALFNNNLLNTDLVVGGNAQEVDTLAQVADFDSGSVGGIALADNQVSVQKVVVE